MWHIDGNDKLKPYEFAIHGALNVSLSNNNPAYVAYYFIQSITELERILQVIRGDRSSENMTLCVIQWFFRRNFSGSFSGYNSFRHGSSTANQ